MIELIFAFILIIGSIGAVSDANGSTIHARAALSCEQKYQFKNHMAYQACVSQRAQNQQDRCVSQVTRVVDGEDAPAAIEACYHTASLREVMDCNGERSCIRNAVLDDDQSDY